MLYSIGSIFLIIGAVFIFLGVLGVIRMPDVVNKLQAGTKATTLGFLSIVLGMLFIRPDMWGKLLLIAFFVLATNPIGSHNLARAARRSREKLVISGVDRISEEEDAS
jgi:multicomponent Na+:H+ antiporter subunit G